MKLTDISGISLKRQELFQKLGVFSFGDLISYFPRSYEDLTHISALNKALFDQNRLLVKVTVEKVQRIPTKKSIALTQIKVKDDTSTAYLNIFGNQPYYQSLLKVGESYLISGIFGYNNGKITSSQFSVETLIDNNNPPQETSLHYYRIVPLYGLTPGLTQKLIRETIFKALNMLPDLKENLPTYLIDNHGLLDRKKALWDIHFPRSFEDLSKAQYRLKYYELFKLQLQFALKKLYACGSKTQSYLKESKLQDKMTQSLPFSLTQAQKEAIKDINQDLESSKNMHRLLLGDVGSGKTIVAIFALLKVIESGYQAVFLAPTEVLAKQHFKTIQKLLDPYLVTMDLLTGSTKGKEKALIAQRLKDGECSLLVGTHAIFSDHLQYKNLSLIIIDEQHKFGVEQRAKLVGKSQSPDLLIMSATPIPRTLTYALFGDMEVSTLKQKPKNRASITTYWATSDDIDSYYQKAKIEIEKGNQCYIVFPIIEESEALDLKSVLQSYENLKNGFFSFTETALLHGKMNDEEKTTAIDQFHKGKVKVLISTTVIEVGVDVASATFMIIEDAHRFGLSTLHQLRGRVGRSDLPSYCVLSTPSLSKMNPESIERMNIMIENDDGFLIAQKDLELRGTGNLLGHQQKGHSGLKMTSLVFDAPILEKARTDAFNIIKDDPSFSKQEHQILKPLASQFEKEILSLLHN